MARHTGPGESARGCGGREGPGDVLSAAALHDLANLAHAATRSAAAARCPGVDRERHLLSIEVALAQITDLLVLLGPGQKGRVRRSSDAGLSVRDAVIEAARVMTPAGLEQGVRVLVEVDDRLASLAMPGLYRAVANAVRNSIEALEGVAGGEIGVRGRVEGDDVVVEVTDNGPGPGAPKAGAGGWGLAVARHVAEQAGGRFELAGEGGGCVWRVRAPVERLIPTKGAA